MAPWSAHVVFGHQPRQPPRQAAPSALHRLQLHRHHRRLHVRHGNCCVPGGGVLLRRPLPSPRMFPPIQQGARPVCSHHIPNNRYRSPYVYCWHYWGKPCIYEESPPVQGRTSPKVPTSCEDDGLVAVLGTACKCAAALANNRTELLPAPSMQTPAWNLPIPSTTILG